MIEEEGRGVLATVTLFNLSTALCVIISYVENQNCRDFLNKKIEALLIALFLKELLKCGYLENIWTTAL